MKLFMKIRILDEAVEGKRTAGRGLSCDMGRRLLNEFKFTKGPTTREILGPIASVNAKTGTLKVLGFDPKELKFPKGSTHFFLNYGVLEYDLKNNLFRFILSEEKVIFEKGADAHDLVFGVVKVQFCKKWADGFDISFAKGAVGIGVV